MGVEKLAVIQEGNGAKPEVGQKVTIHFVGYGRDGDLTQIFYNTKGAGQKALSFTIGKGLVIKGWDEGVLDMKKGEIARLKCTPDYAYESGSFPSWGIARNSTVIFEIEVLDIKDE